jgi:hypothetical protein
MLDNLINLMLTRRRRRILVSRECNAMPGGRHLSPSRRLEFRPTIGLLSFIDVKEKVSRVLTRVFFCNIHHHVDLLLVCKPPSPVVKSLVIQNCNEGKGNFLMASTS